MVWRNIKGKTGKLGYSGNLGFSYSNLVKDIKKGRVDYVKIPIEDGTFNMSGVDSSIMAILKIKPTESQLDNIYSQLPEDLADLNGDYNRANLYVGRENPRQIIPKYFEDGYGVERYEIKGILESDNSPDSVYKTELIDKLKENSPFVRLIVTKFENLSKKEGGIEQTLSLGMDSNSLEIQVVSEPFVDNGIDLLGNDGMEGLINDLDLYVDLEAQMYLKETPLNSGRRFLRKVAEPFYRLSF